MVREKNIRMVYCIAALAVALGSGVLHASQGNQNQDDKFESLLLPRVELRGNAQGPWTLKERMEHWGVPGISLAVIRNGEIAWSRGYGVLQAGGSDKVDDQTMFSVGSLSKVGAASMALRMVDEGKLELDTDINRYLKQWKVPVNQYTVVQPVTLRGILSHTAGLNVSGFQDFMPGEELPTTLDVLQGRRPAKNQALRVNWMPGSKYSYSGGGTTIVQLLMEELTGKSFNEAAQQYLFQPIGMLRSSYENPLPATYGNVAKAHGPKGEARALPRGYEAMPEMAASGMWTTPTDYAKLVVALMESYKNRDDGFLSRRVAHQMMTEVGRSDRGLGPSLGGFGNERFFFHGGSNDSYKAYMEGHLVTGNGVVVFTNGENGSFLIEEVVRAIGMAEGWSKPLIDHNVVSPIELSEDEMRELVGIYSIESDKSSFRMRGRDNDPLRLVEYKDGNINVSRGDKNYFEKYVPLAPHVFIADNGFRKIEFIRDYTGSISGLLEFAGSGLDKKVEYRKARSLP